MTNRSDIKWRIMDFSEMDLELFHDVLKLRIDVFVIEQNCPYDELDGKDQNAIHVIGKGSNNDIRAYARILKPNAEHPAAIGRVVVRNDLRSSGLGHELMSVCLNWIKTSYGSSRSVLSAQEHLQGFYGKHGYKTTSEVYDLDGIPHVDMLLEST